MRDPCDRDSAPELKSASGVTLQRRVCATKVRRRGLCNNRTEENLHGSHCAVMKSW